MSKSSTNSDKDFYLRGYPFWNTTGAFWRNNNLYSKKVQASYEVWLDNLRKKEHSLIRL